MPTELILHAGMHKTGTTALQQVLSGYDDGRLRHARLGYLNHSIPFVTAFSRDPHRYHVWKRLGASADRVAQERRAALVRLQDELALPHPVLSVIGEEISLFTPASLRGMAELVAASGRALRLFAYLRDPAGYVTSAFQQQVRGGQPDYTLPRPLYRLRFEPMRAIFGQDRLCLRVYDPAAFPEASVVADYSRVLGLADGTLPDVRANLSLPLPAVQLLHLLNAQGAGFGSETGRQARSLLIRDMIPAFDTPFTLPEDLVAAAIDRAEVEWLATTFGVDFTAQLDRAPALDHATAQRALAALLRDIARPVLDWLCDSIAARGLTPQRAEGPGALVAQLYAAYHAERGQKSHPPAALAS